MSPGYWLGGAEWGVVEPRRLAQWGGAGPGAGRRGVGGLQVSKDQTPRRWKSPSLLVTPILVPFSGGGRGAAHWLGTMSGDFRRVAIRRKSNLAHLPPGVPRPWSAPSQRVGLAVPRSLGGRALAEPAGERGVRVSSTWRRRPPTRSAAISSAGEP